MHWNYKLRRHSGGYAQSLLEILRLIVFQMEMGLHISLKMHFFITPMFFVFFGKLDAIRDHQGK